MTNGSKCTARRDSASAENQRPVSIEVATGAGYTRPPLHDFFMTRYTEAYAAEIAAFIQAVSGKGKAAPSGEDGLAALALSEAALKSVAEGRSVKLSEITVASVSQESGRCSRPLPGSSP